MIYYYLYIDGNHFASVWMNVIKEIKINASS